MNAALLSPDAIHRLKQVRAQILAEPNLYRHDIVAMRNSCGTVMCVAGWLCHFAGRQEDFGLYSMREAAVILGISEKIGMELFNPNVSWMCEPLITNAELHELMMPDFYAPEKRAKICAKLIDRFIAKYSRNHEPHPQSNLFQLPLLGRPENPG